MRGRELKEYYVFIASPGDVALERTLIREYFDNLNRTIGLARRVRLQVIDWENFSTLGAGRPQGLITGQTLRRFQASLALVIVVMAQRFGSPTGEAESGTEEEVRWALASNAESGFPEVKFFFREIGQFVAPANPIEIREAVEQWEHVIAFRREIETSRSALLKTYSDSEHFQSALREDLDIWFNSEGRPWNNYFVDNPVDPVIPDDQPRLTEYLNNLVLAYQWLDIAGIDSDRAFKLSLEQIYVRLRVIQGENGETSETGDATADTAALTIQDALQRYRRLVIVGDPGSGKSTFLRFIALTLAQSTLSGDTPAAMERLSLDTPLPIPMYVSCWDLSEHLRKSPKAHVADVLDFIFDRVTESSWRISRQYLEKVLRDGICIILIDGLDEVSTDEGRNLISGLIDAFVETYSQNRYVVTSRIRAYTGATVLGQQFARCDIQPFAKEERTAFLQNWVGQLFTVRGQGDSDGIEAAAELKALSEAIETSSIRSLAVNPLLLTVIAIVHWNRKRLPEQRVDLYDECIDVLLGQRKQAEQQRTSRDTRVLDPGHIDSRLDQRVWVRKRFAEIAFNILSRTDEEIDHAAVIELLEPHFRTSDGDEASRARAERFIDRQELSSGLFVRRRGSNYRFVHLTFQEYLAAWFLANRDLTLTLDTVVTHIRDPKWFETLQLLGGALANRSDEYLDRYVSRLLDSVGDTIREQAPVIALSANIVRDTQAVAGVNTDTRQRYEALLRETLDAFAPISRVPKQTQLDLLEALGGLGPPVKDHLMLATRSRLLDIRRRALEILVPYLSDDDLFSMKYLLADRSREPIKTYLNAIVERDRVRAGEVVLDLSLHGEKTLDALQEAASPRIPQSGLEMWPGLVWRFAARFGWISATGLLVAWDDHRDATSELFRNLAEADWPFALEVLVQTWPEREQNLELTRRLAKAGEAAAVKTLAERWGERDDTWELLTRLDDVAIQRLATESTKSSVPWDAVAFLDAVVELGDDGDAVWALVDGRGDHDDTWELIKRLAEAGSDNAVQALAERRDDRDDTWELIKRLAEAGSDSAVQALAERRDDRDDTWELIRRLAEAGSDSAVQALVNERNDRDDLLIKRLAEAGSDSAVQAPAFWRGDRDDTWELIKRLAEAGSDSAVQALAFLRGDRDDTWELIKRLAEGGSDSAVLALTYVPRDSDHMWELLKRLDDAALNRLVSADALSFSIRTTRMHSQTDWVLLKRLAAAGSAPAMQSLINQSGGSEDTWELITRQAEAGSESAIQALANRRGDRDDTWELIRRQAEAGSEGAVQALAVRRGDRDDTWELIGRLAEAGSKSAFQTLVNRRGARSDTWTLMDRLADRGSAEARSLMAWREWAIATAGINGTADLHV